MRNNNSFLIFLFSVLTACSRPQAPRTLPLSTDLGSYGPYRWTRVITHMHTPYSFDACDSAGLSGSVVGGTVNASCLSHFRDAICKNRIDYTFTTDHINFFIYYGFEELLLKQTGDTIVNSNLGTPYYNRLSGCDSGFVPVLSAGYEDNLIGIGLKQHLSANTAEAVRKPLYSGNDATTKSLIQSTGEGVVIIPHTEDKSVSTIQSIAPDAIEFYNLHANLDPKIRKKYLTASGYQIIGNMISYILDPYGDLIPDFAFITFIEQFGVYVSKWNQLISGGLNVTGVAAVDSHENVLSMGVADGERFDSYRRTSKIASNWVAVTTSDIDLVKTSIKQNRVLMVYEGFGTPVGFDFNATVGATTGRMGDTVSLGGGTATIHVTLPTLHYSSPRGITNPRIKIVVKRVTTLGGDTTIGESTDSSLTVTTSTAGAYRAEVYITPYHLKEYLGTFGNFSNNEQAWITSNHLYLN